LAAFPISAYSVSLALDGSAVFLLTSNAAYRLELGQPPKGIELELGAGAVLTRSAFVFWSKGTIWRAPKEGGETQALAKFAHSPQYFVASGEAFAWVDRADDGLYTIQTLQGRKPRVLFSSTGELSGLNMLGESIYFVQRHQEGSWRIGVVPLGGGEPRFTAQKEGRRPSMLAGADALYYYDLDQSEVLRLSLDFARSEARSKNVTCSPLAVANAIYCGSVEGLFEISQETRRPRGLALARSGSITHIAANPEWIAWTIDVGPDKLAVDLLPASRER
jgi:hypothetical protein